MGYGLGTFLLAVGLILALAVQDSLSGVDLTMVGWILTGAGVLVLALTVFTLNRPKGMKTSAATTHSDGSQTMEERETRET